MRELVPLVPMVIDRSDRGDRSFSTDPRLLRGCEEVRGKGLADPVLPARALAPVGAAAA